MAAACGGGMLAIGVAINNIEMHQPAALPLAKCNKHRSAEIAGSLEGGCEMKFLLIEVQVLQDLQQVELRKNHTIHDFQAGS